MTYTIRLGYACINTELREFDIFTSRSLILKTARDKGFSYINGLIKSNIDDLLKILIYNEAHGIRFFRITSCLFPHLCNPQLTESNYDIDFVKDELKMIGKYARLHGHRLTTHPGQYVQLGSNNDAVVKQSIIELENHAKLFKYLGLTPNDGSVMIIHGGGTYGDKISTLARWQENFHKLPKWISQYIALENDENCYSITDLLPFCEENQIPFCVDIFHNQVSKNRIPITKKLMGKIFDTWLKKGLQPKLHYSNQEPGLRRGTHSKTINKIPRFFLRLPSIYHTSIDIMLEVKDKEVSVFKIYYRYFDIKMDSSGRIYYLIKEKYL
jgi:UV DNA damage endonuclease